MHAFVRRAYPIVAAAAVLAGLTSCKVLNPPNSADTVVLTAFDSDGCAGSSNGTHTNCTATLGLFVSKSVVSGYVSAFIAYPDGTHFYHGQVATPTNPVGDIAITLLNETVSSCPDGYSTQIKVYDGQQTASNPRLLATVPITLYGVC